MAKLSPVVQTKSVIKKRFQLNYHLLNFIILSTQLVILVKIAKYVGAL